MMLNKNIDIYKLKYNKYHGDIDGGKQQKNNERITEINKLLHENEKNGINIEKNK